MSWVVIVIGLAVQPTFHGGYSKLSDCKQREQHINSTYPGLVRAACLDEPTAIKLGYSQDE